MRYHILATDYDGTLADNGKVDQQTVEKLKKLKSTGRLLVLVTGREMRYLTEDFPDYKVFDQVVAENGAVLVETSTGKEQLLGEAPDAQLIQALKTRGVGPISIGKVIIATWEPHELAVLQVIKELGLERQVIFNKGAVMILPSGINKASGLKTLLRQLHYSEHNLVAVGDAENDGAMLELAECGVAVSNALPAVKKIADYTTKGKSGKGVVELIDSLMGDDLAEKTAGASRHRLELGNYSNGDLFSIAPSRSGILLSGVSGGGKTTFTLAIIESLIKNTYQFCLIDPEGDYLELEGAMIIGNETNLPTIEELMALLRDPGKNLVICILSIPLAERPAYFSRFLMAFSKLKYESGHPHWLLLDEAHHLLPADRGPDSYPVPDDFRDFVLITLSPDQVSKQALCKTGMIMVVGNNTTYPIEQFCNTMKLPLPVIPPIAEDEMCVWDHEKRQRPTAVRIFIPEKLLKRHKRKYAQGDMTYNSFVFTGPEKKLNLVAMNLMMFKHLAEGIDDDTWLFHLKRKDFTHWFKDKVHDQRLAEITEEMEKQGDAVISKKQILNYIGENYMA
jgi:hydroxymethylpyrimidine pyrophosphatase-like HAD family hydrolase